MGGGRWWAVCGVCLVSRQPTTAAAARQRPLHARKSSLIPGLVTNRGARLVNVFLLEPKVGWTRRTHANELAIFAAVERLSTREVLA